MSRRRTHGKLHKLTRADRQRKAARNERRKRSVEAVRWAKAHIVKERPSYKVETRTKQHREAIRVAEELKRVVPAVKDAKVGRGVIVPPFLRRARDRGE